MNISEEIDELIALFICHVYNISNIFSYTCVKEKDWNAMVTNMNSLSEPQCDFKTNIVIVEGGDGGICTKKKKKMLVSLQTWFSFNSIFFNQINTRENFWVQ